MKQWKDGTPNCICRKCGCAMGGYCSSHLDAHGTPLAMGRSYLWACPVCGKDMWTGTDLSRHFGTSDADDCWMILLGTMHDIHAELLDQYVHELRGGWHVETY
jgi:hypothetical protein